MAFFMPVFCASQKDTQRKIAKCTKRLKMKNRYFVQNARKGASLAEVKVLLNVTLRYVLLNVTLL